MKHVLLLLILFACGMRANAQTCAPRAVIVNVLDARGLAVSNLSAKNFKASFRGHTLNLANISFVRAPATRTAVLLDTSASMAGLGAQGINKWMIARAAAAEFLTAAPPEAQVSLLTFSGNIGRNFKAAEGRQPMQDWIGGADSMRSSNLKGKAAIQHALLEAAKAMEPTRPGDAIYIITDGRNDEEHAMLSAVADKLQANGVRLYSFVLNDSRPADALSVDGGVHGESGPPPSPGPAQLNELVRGAGGFGYSFYPGGEKVGIAFGASYAFDDRARTHVRDATYEIESAISSFYLLSAEALPDAHGLANWQLEVVDDQGKKRKDVNVVYPNRLPGCVNSH